MKLVLHIDEIRTVKHDVVIEVDSLKITGKAINNLELYGSRPNEIEKYLKNENIKVLSDNIGFTVSCEYECNSFEHI